MTVSKNAILVFSLREARIRSGFTLDLASSKSSIAVRRLKKIEGGAKPTGDEFACLIRLYQQVVPNFAELLQETEAKVYSLVEGIEHYLDPFLECLLDKAERDKNRKSILDDLRRKSPDELVKYLRLVKNPHYWLNMVENVKKCR